MAVTRKDFQAIASALARTRPDVPESPVHDQWRHDRDAIAAALHDVAGLNTNGNRRFDIDRFTAACEA